MSEKPKGTDLPDTPEPMIKHVEVLVIGAGPLGCTFARKLVKAGKSVFLIDAGPQLSPRPGEHLKNAYLYQRDVNQFTGVISGHLHPLSVPTDTSTVPTLDPAAFKFDPEEYKGYIRDNMNPDQDAYYNLPDAAATYAVGGMATHWTAATPREFPGIERSNLLTDDEWDELYDEAERSLKTNNTMFDTIPGTKIPSIRNHVVKETLRKAFPNLVSPQNKPQSLPLAGERPKNTPKLVIWSGGDTVLGDELIDMLGTPDSKLTLKPSWQCKKVVRAAEGGCIEYAVVKDLFENTFWHIHAKVFVIAAGAVLTPQILYKSEIRPKALGHYLCEQPLTFCQIVLLQSIVDQIPKDPRWASIVKEYQKRHPEDPVPIPMFDPTPQCWIPVSENRPWHCQVHRDAFSYGGVAPNVDTRLIVDLRWFGLVEPCFDNCVTFSDVYRDTYGMPQPTFHFETHDDDAKRAHLMMEDMLVAAGALGGFLPGAEPSFQKPGLALHITGTCRMGAKDDDTCVVDTYSRLWDYKNLFLGTCGVIPTGAACNPTLTAVALAIRSSNYIIDNWATITAT